MKNYFLADGMKNYFNTIYEISLNFCNIVFHKTDHLEKLDTRQDFAETGVRRKKKTPDELCEKSPQVRYNFNDFRRMNDC